MLTFNKVVAVGALVLAVALPSFAIAPMGQSQPAPSIDTTGTIERGGTVNAVDLKNKKIVVDGTTYALRAELVKIHPPTNIQDAKTFQLEPGMKIRFNTSKNNFSAAMQVNEIWVSNAVIEAPKR